MESPLLPPEELRTLPPDDLVILDARPAADYESGHLPGARHADLETQLSCATENPDPAHGGRHPLPPLDRWLDQVAEWGIEPSTMVVVYDDQSGANAAARAWWMLRAIGHERVRVLDGDWRTVPSPQTEEAASTSNPPSVRHVVTAWQLPTAGMPDVDRLRHDERSRVLDVRTGERFRGETEPIDPVAGHIPGAVNLPYFDNLEGGRFKSAGDLRQQYETFLKGVPPERVIVHCGSGVTACHTLLALEAAGLSGAALYVGSWGEWCRNEMPVGRNPAE
jgi:thiosulfate/3-mercaptopyruvate sulfurtransferase